jgi:hypothetical protein
VKRTRTHESISIAVEVAAIKIRENFNNKMRTLIGFFLIYLLVGLTYTWLPKRHVCPCDRPDICPLVWAPVCGHTADGLANTYSNSCHACVNRTVVWWTRGACHQVTLNRIAVRPKFIIPASVITAANIIRPVTVIKAIDTPKVIVKACDNVGQCNTVGQVAQLK